ncbi:MAG: Hsp20/alpha crystallin family protein [Deltaproteobacteria bacterium]|nr:Hsp20/alpha crystallin family protein [Deltaproteobacteria bacterium]
MLTRWDPFAPLSEMSRLHDLARQSQSFRPAVDIVESPDAFEVRAEIPGMKAEDIHIDVEKNVLTLRGERQLEETTEGTDYKRVERSYGTFTRSFTLPETVDDEQIEAKLTDGVLTVRLPKREAPSARRIEVAS